MSEQLAAAANAIRALSMEAITKAKSGHPGMPLGMADLAAALWAKHLQYNPQNPNWRNRDRFVLSNGHGSVLLYAILHLTGYALSIDDIKNFRQMGAKTAGHPEYDLSIGIETTTGPLGQGLATAVGMALAEKMLAAKYNQPEFPIVDHHTYVFAGDGDLMEGVSHETCALAGTWALNKLIVIWDDNGITIDGKTEGWMTTNVAERFKAYGWEVIENVDGHDFEAINKAIAKAKTSSHKPVLICAKTHIGFKSPYQNTAKSHGSPLSEEDIAKTKAALGWQYDAFEVPVEIYEYFAAKQAADQSEQHWQTLWQRYEQTFPELAAQYNQDYQLTLPATFAENLQSFIQTAIAEQPVLATRHASAKVIEFLASHIPNLCGGSADLAAPTGTAWPTMSALQPQKADGFAANYIHYGVREFGMSAIMNGLQLHGGFTVFGGTFLSFSDYARPAVRLSALMNNRVIYVYTHDSIGLGEDGPTHQPVEHIDSLRLMPNLQVWRPADVVEAAQAWASALAHAGPTVLLFSRQKVPTIIDTVQQAEDAAKGAYIVKDFGEAPEMILFATGAEVSLALDTAAALLSENMCCRVVSVPCMEVFFAQPAEYQQTILSQHIQKRVAIEAGSAALWAPFIGMQGLVCGVNAFGHSAPYQHIYEHFGLTPAAISQKVLQHF